jgi:trimeric autotransporter adhesin
MKPLSLLILTLSVSFRLAATIGPITGATSICAGSIKTLTDTSSGGAWSSSDTAILKVGSTGVIRGMDSGTATITYSVDTSYVVATIIVHPAALPITGYSGSPVCCGDYIYLYDATPGGGTWTGSNPYVDVSGWSPGSICSDTAVVDFWGGGGYEVITFTDTFGCTATLSILEYPSPAPITGPSSVNVGNSITLGGGWWSNSWYSNNTAIATVDASSGVVTGVSPGMVVIGSTNYCGDIGNSITVLPPVGISTNSGRDLFSVYPNPANDWLQLSGSSGMEIRLKDITGRMLKTLTMNSASQTLSITDLQPGVYLVESVGGDGERKCVRVVKE